MSHTEPPVYRGYVITKNAFREEYYASKGRNHFATRASMAEIHKAIDAVEGSPQKEVTP